MRDAILYWLFLTLSILSSPACLDGAWDIRKIDSDTSLSSTRLSGELAAYEKDGDIYLYRLSSGRLTPVTQNLFDPTDKIIDLKEEQLWYWARAWGETTYELCEYDARLGQHRRHFVTEAAVTLDHGVADTGRLVIGMDHDWWLYSYGVLRQLTFSGEDLCKQQPWLHGEHLVWRAVAGTPGVYVTHLSTRETWCAFEDDVPPSSLCASGLHAAWVKPPDLAGDRYRVVHYRLDTRTIETVGTSEEEASWQLAMEFPYLIWLKKTGPSWLLMRTDLETGAEECLYSSDRPMLSTRVSGDDVLLVTENCPESSERCWEVNVFDQRTGLFSQLTYFGSGNIILSPRIDGGRIAFIRRFHMPPPLPDAREALVCCKIPGPSSGPCAASDP